MATNAYKSLDEYLAMPWSYSVEWHAEDGGYYLVRVNELSGCMTDGETIPQAFTNIREAMTGWLLATMDAGNEIPEPVRPTDYKGQFSVRTTPEKHWRLAKVSQRRQKSINQLINEAIDTVISEAG